VTKISTLDHVLVAESDWGTVRGRVWDSLRMAPLANAEVFLTGTTYRTRTDSVGRFTLSGLSGGAFQLAFHHPVLDTLGVLIPPTDADVLPGGLLDIDLAIPSRATLAGASCPGELSRDSLVAFVGQVRGWTGGDPVPGTRVEVKWNRQRALADGMDLTARPGLFLEGGFQGLATHTDMEGWFTLCGVPRSIPLLAHAAHLGHQTDPVELISGEESPFRLDFVLGLSPGFLTTASRIDELRLGEGTQGVQGRIMDRASGDWIEGASVRLEREQGLSVDEALTDERGRFRLLTPVDGRYSLVVEAFGYASATIDGIMVRQGYLAILDLSLAPEALELEPLVVTAESRNLHLDLQGFYERRESSGGYFITPEAIEAIPRTETSRLLLGIPGVNFIKDDLGHEVIAMARTEGLNLATCWPRILVDGFVTHEGGYGTPPNLDGMIDPLNVAGIEVYRSPAELPIQYSGTESRCGVIVIWSKRGG